jgi:hypothetical protein
MAPSLRSLVLLSTDALFTHAVYTLIAGAAVSLYAGVVTKPTLAITLLVAVLFMGCYYVIYRLVGMVSVPRPPNAIKEPDGTAPFEIPFLSNTGENDDFESTKRWSRYMNGSDAGGVLAVPIIVVLLTVTLLGWSAIKVLQLGGGPTLGNALEYTLYSLGPEVYVMIFSSFVTSFWIANRLMHQYAPIYPDSHTRPLDGKET